MNPTELRADIPALEEAIYLNTGASGPSPRRVVDAIGSTLEYHEYDAHAGKGPYEATADADDTARTSVAALLGASPTEIALTQSTTDGINRVAGAIDWDETDVVVRTDLEHAAGILPWRRLERERGVDVRVLETEGGRLDLEATKAVAGEATLFCLSSLTWSHGTQLPVSEVVETAHEAGAYVLVDAVQSVGQTAIDVHEWGADFVAAAGHKWLLGPFGAGFLYVRDGVERDLAPSAIGYRSVEDPYADPYEYSPGAGRFEAGTTSPALAAGLEAAIELFGDVGVETVEERIATLTDRLKAGLDDDRLLSPREYESGLVTIAADDPEATVSRLAEEGIVVRSLPFPEAVRVSVHAFNTPEDVDAVLEAL
ncbi:aminotransferase class V-fold PLP-dependent enzyme [Natrialbaceae archaeon AArc-T1-2]|uniref:aminotransferase class V-fold PLP-dependent enzyme n=1 Tax=Natrialbaceae archaeon AArc-T1-2 TaxID=3053904 RepID=UPI00255ABF74|nr:aminotransferase class V-fold PLP-dependent enzyme [Natrialbaceae archaeon AArc-T1-2]WIV67254.1 aminotransferase class V-fold PLP-dependent enzyme [Natrialbaceae archaeon AArc-T1-2]